MAMRSGVYVAIKKKTPLAGSATKMVLELECNHVIIRDARDVGERAHCPECTKVAKPPTPKPLRSGDVRDALIAELRAQNDYLRALNGLSPNKAQSLPAAPVAVPVAERPIPPKPPDDVRECKKCKHVGVVSEDFGWVLINNRSGWRPQALCKRCNGANLKAARERSLAAKAAQA